MRLIKLKPNTPGTRHTIKIDKSLLLKNNFLYKNLIEYKHRFVGRSATTGHITVRHKGGGHKKKYRSLDFLNEQKTGIVIAIAYDPNRTSFISLNFDLEKKTFYTAIASDYLFTGFISSCNKKFPALKFGYRTTLQNVPTGSIVNNISLNAALCSKYARSAGTSCQIVQKTFKNSKLRLPSGKIIEISNDAFVTLGVNSNTQHNLICIGKAGKNRLKGLRPKVRGIAMNPVDHPHGGRTNSGFVYVTPWGIPTKGVKTRKKNKI
jgi:large subunit ribosomal protein L2